MSDPFAGRALVTGLLGVVVVAAGWLAERRPVLWQAACAGTTVLGALFVLSATLAPPAALTASLGVGLCLVGSVLTVVGVVVAMSRRPTDGVTGPGGATRAASDSGDDRSDHGPAESVGDAVGVSVGDAGGESVDLDTDGSVTTDARAPGTRAVRRPTRRRVIVGVAILAGLALGYVVAWPADVPALESRASATQTHAEAVERFAELVADETDLGVLDACRSRLLTHDDAAAVSVVLFHGLTNCPKQFAEFGRRLFENGANVVILRAPEHGIADATGSGIGGVENVSDLTAEDLRDYADDAIDVATGLGDEVRVLGLSMGGVVSAWSAHHRADVDRVVAVAPALTIPFVPASFTHLFRNVFGRLPNIALPTSGSELDHVYTGGTTKGLDATFTMAASVADQAYRSPPAAGDVIVVLNPADDQVDPDHLTQFTSAWASSGGEVSLHRLPDAGLPHDVIDGDQPDADIELVYPILFDLLDGGA